MRCNNCEYYIPHTYSQHEAGNCGLFLDMESTPTKDDSLGCKYNKITLESIAKKQDKEFQKELEILGIDIDNI